MRQTAALVLLAVAALSSGCRARDAGQSAAAARPSILLVTLDTTRADAIGPDASTDTPSFNQLAARGLRFRQAYATVPETLPSHISMLTGLYPAGHGVHENARYVADATPLLAERLHAAGYRTTAFVSAFALARRFGLGRGFDVYDETFPAAQSERPSRATTDAALADLAQPATAPRFMWVHYYDPHAPYAPPEPFRSRFAGKPYYGEVAAMDEQLGRLVRGFEQHAPGPVAIVVAADHGEGLGDHGEAQHGQLLYQSTMHVPLVIAGPGIAPGTSDVPVSTRRIFFTILDLAGLGAEGSLRAGRDETVLGEAMKPFLEYGWQPQVMAVAGRFKSILAGTVETYDVAADPGETHDLGSAAAVPSGMRKELEAYPAPSPDVARAPDNLDAEAKRRLAALGYVSAGAAPVVRKDAPRPADMTALFPVIERASALFAAGEYRAAIPVLERILAADAHNLDAALRLATAHSILGEADQAIAAFRVAAAIAPQSQDVRTYLALHYARTPEWPRAIPLLEAIVAESPGRLTAVDALAGLELRQGREAMDRGDTAAAIAAFERARQLSPSTFANDLELGVLYLAARRFEDARAALDRALAAHPADAMALFKRAQVSVLLREPDARARIELAKKRADAVTRPLIEHEELFRQP
jgi:arylsulfatase A-like enzyme/Flp pilus assembly protein TadD